MTQRVVVIIPNYNGANLLPDCLAALSRQTLTPDRIIVVDNASSDDSLALLRNHWPKIDILECDRNRGFAGAVQQGINASNEPFIALLNNDARPEPQWLEALISCFSIQEIGSVSSLMYTSAGNIESVGIGISLVGVGFRLMEGEVPDRVPSFMFEIFGASGGAMMLRRKALFEAGGFEEMYFAQDEDIDLAFRLRYAGFTSVSVPSARVLHLGGQTLKRNPTRSLSLAQRNLEWAFWLNIPVWTWFIWGPVHILYQSASLLRHALRGRGALVWAAKLEAIQSLPHLIRERKRPKGFLKAIFPWIGRQYRVFRPTEDSGEKR